ncbi:myosin phosphatase Rho-interacting protein-like isoform X3 [Petromyzon marinus]|uniref:myosin phosphatase Rho-interacting protein-like isoform X3 n=1 Tax=Petromyzon marinus TaxID=7757 RepID=UPI003F72E14F
MPAPEGHCQRFEANIFDRSRCQNCFKPREQHLVANEYLGQARPVYGGWLCLAPEGTNFENAGHRSRKWQRRFFVLFEHGGLQFALDSSPSTLPQGTLNLAQCTEVTGAEERTGRKHSLRIAAPDRELFIGGESREDISAWHARLVALARGSRTNHVKKRRAEVQLEQDVIVTHAVQVNMSIPVDPAHRSPNVERMDPPRCSVTRCPAGVGARPDRPPSGTFSFEPAAHRAHPGPSATTEPPATPPRSHNGSRGDERDHRRQLPPSSPHGAQRSSAAPPPREGVPALPRGRSPRPGGPAPPQDARDFWPPTPRGRSPEARHGSASQAQAPSADHANGTRSPYPRGRSPGPRVPVEHAGGGNWRIGDRDDDDDDDDGGGDLRRRSRGGGGATPNAGGVPYPRLASTSDSDTSGGGGGSGGGREYASLADVPRARRIGHRDTFVAEKRRLEHKLRTRSPGRDEVERLFGKGRRSLGQPQGPPHDREMERPVSSDVDERVDASFHSPVAREPQRWGTRPADTKVMGGAPMSSGALHPSHGSFRRSQSLDRQNAGLAPTADSASLKKGWLSWLDDDAQWRKFWFVLTPGTLKFYRDTPSEERDHAEGVVELSPHCAIADFQVQRNFGFQIKTKYAVHTLAAVTPGIRKSWMEAISQSPGLGGSAQDKMSSPDKSWPGRSPSSSSRDGPVTSATVETREPSPDQARSRPKARLREVRAKTMDCSEFQAVHQALVRSQRGGGGVAHHSVRSSAPPPVRMDQSGRSEDGGGAGVVPGNGTYKTYFQTSRAAAQAGPRTGQEAPRNAAAAAAPSDRFQPRAVASRPAEPDARPAVATPQGQKPPHVRSTPAREAGGVASPGIARGALNLSDGKPRAVVATSVSQTRLLPDKQGPDPSWAPSDRGRAAGDEADGPGDGGGRRRPGREGEAAGAAAPRAPLSRDEIEQRWRQVEKTPVREEKQIPIATIKPTASSMSPESMVELLQKEVEELRWQLEHVQQDLRSSRGENSALLARLRALEQSEYPPAGFVSQLNIGVAAADYQSRRSGGKEGLLEHGARPRRSLTGAQIHHGHEEPAAATSDDDDDERCVRAPGSRPCKAEARLRETEEALVHKTKACLELEEAASSAQERHRLEARRLQLRLDDAEERLASAVRDLAAAERRQADGALADAERSRREAAEAVAKEAAARRLEAEERRRAELEERCLRLQTEVARLESERTSVSQEEAEVARSLERKLAQSEASALALSRQLRAAEEDNETLRSQKETLERELLDAHRSDAALAGPEERPVVQIDGQPMEWLDKEIELQDLAARHRAELRDTKASFQKEAERLRAEARRAEEALRARALESVQEMDSLTVCMEAMQRKHREELRQREDDFREELSRRDRRLQELSREASDRHRQEVAALTGDARARERRFGSALKALLQQLPGWEENGPAECRAGRQSTDETAADDGGDLESAHLVELLAERVEETLREFGVAKRELELLRPQGDPAALRDAFQRDLEEVKAMCERGLAAMEESHQRSMEDLQRKHQHDMQLLRQQSEQLLAEETAATIAALEAMKSAHRDEFERELEKALKSRHGTGSQDAELIRKQHEEELASIQRELGVLSEQYSQKCLENSHLSQALDAERQALQQCQRENEELNTRCQELNKRLATELMRIRSIVTGDSNGAVPSLAPGKDTYELEVMLRVKDSEIQYFKQEINALKEELQSALRDKKYATDKYKDIYTELSISRAKADLDVTRLREQLQTISQGEERAGYDILKSKSIPDFFKTQTTSSCKRTVRNLRSKSLREGLSTQEQKQLFDEAEVQQ